MYRIIIASDSPVALRAHQTRASLGVPPTVAIWLRLGGDECDNGARVEIVTDDLRVDACARVGEPPIAGDGWIRITLIDEGLRGRLVAHVARGSALRLGDGDCA
jgi:hypothetical protein